MFIRSTSIAGLALLAAVAVTAHHDDSDSAFSFEVLNRR